MPSQLPMSSQLPMPSQLLLSQLLPRPCQLLPMPSQLLPQQELDADLDTEPGLAPGRPLSQLEVEVRHLSNGGERERGRDLTESATEPWGHRAPAHISTHSSRSEPVGSHE